MSETNIVSSALIVVCVCFSLLDSRFRDLASFLVTKRKLLSLIAGLSSGGRNAPVGILLLLLIS